MARYCLDSKSQPNGEHLIHLMDCMLLPDISRCTLLGDFNTYEEARAEALKRFPSVNACYLCLRQHFQAG